MSEMVFNIRKFHSIELLLVGWTPSKTSEAFEGYLMMDPLTSTCLLGLSGIYE